MIKVENYKVLIEGEFLEVMLDFVSIASVMKDKFPEEVWEAMRAVFILHLMLKAMKRQ